MQTVIEIVPEELSIKPEPSSKLLTQMKSEGKKAEEYSETEIRRICKLPIIDLLNPAECEAFCRNYLNAEEYERGFRLFPAQINSILAYKVFNGLFAPIGVGWGKTLITVCIANEAYLKGMQKIMLCVPVQTYPQLVYTDIPWIRGKTNIVVPFIFLGNKAKGRREFLTRIQKPGCYVVPYSLLSVADTGTIIANISPEILILDEVHKLKNKDAARTKRVMKYINEKKPEVVALSGTITSKGVRDYHHLIRAALKENCPLPISPKMAMDWGCVIDATAQPSTSQQGPLKPLIKWAIKNFPEQDFPFEVAGFRKAYKQRLHTAPGVVHTGGDADIPCSLWIQNIPTEKPEACCGWDDLKRLIAKILEEWVTPDGDEIDHAIHTYKWMYELSAGFYNSLFWPTVPEYAARKKISEAQATELLNQAKEHHKRNQAYAKLLRDFLKHHHKDNLDTPMLVGLDMKKHGDKNVPEDMYEAWLSMKELERDDLPERDSKPIRVCDFKIENALAWVNTIEDGAIIWVHHQEMGVWMSEALERENIPYAHCPAQADELILDKKLKDRIVVASITAHGEGKNLQHFHNQYFLQWPRNAAVAEQTLGRLHRSGQEEDVVLAVTNHSLDFDKMNFGACLNDSLYIHQSTGTRQKLIYATYFPDNPEIFPSEVLKERGYNPQILNAEQWRAMEDRFRKNAVMDY